MKFTRRDAIKAGAGAAASLMLGWRPGFAQSGELVRNPIPSSGELLPAVGIGTNNYVASTAGERAPLMQTVRTVLEHGGTLFDTAPSYGNSETVLGHIFSDLGVRDQIFLATKVDQPGDAGRRQIEDSFRYLQTDMIDLIQVHNLVDTSTNLATLRDLREQGRVRYIGITTWDEAQYGEFEAVIRNEEMDFIQVDYALDNRAAGERLLPLAEERGFAALVNVPFGRGRLFRAVGDQPLPDWATALGCTTWGQVFLNYVSSHPAVTAPIPGTTQQRHAVDNMAAAHTTPADAATRREMERFVDALPS